MVSIEISYRYTVHIVTPWELLVVVITSSLDQSRHTLVPFAYADHVVGISDI